MQRWRRYDARAEQSPYEGKVFGRYGGCKYFTNYFAHVGANYIINLCELSNNHSSLSQTPKHGFQSAVEIKKKPLTHPYLIKASFILSHK